MTQLYMIRHGEAISAVERRLGNTGLSPLGIKQAERLRDRLAATGEIAADVLIASTLLRARQTAEIIAPALGLPLLLGDEVQEMREGEALGLTEQEYRAKYNGGANFDADPFRPVSPGGENWPQFMLRVGTALDRILREHAGKTIVIVCHGGVIEGSFLYFFGMNTLALPRALFDTHNTSITHWRYDDLSARGRRSLWRLVKYNDDLHVRDIDLPISIPWREVFARPRSGEGQQQPAAPVPTEGAGRP